MERKEKHGKRLTELSQRGSELWLLESHFDWGWGKTDWPGASLDGQCLSKPPPQGVLKQDASDLALTPFWMAAQKELQNS